MKNRAMTMLLIALVACLSVACRDRHAEFMAKQLPEGMRADFMDYYDGGGYKAFAVAIDEGGLWAFGSAYNASSLTSAKGWAIKRCKIAKLRQPTLEANCSLFAVGDDFAN